MQNSSTGFTSLPTGGGVQFFGVYSNEQANKQALTFTSDSLNLSIYMFVLLSRYLRLYMISSLYALASLLVSYLRVST